MVIFIKFKSNLPNNKRGNSKSKEEDELGNIFNKYYLLLFFYNYLKFYLFIVIK